MSWLSSKKKKKGGGADERHLTSSARAIEQRRKKKRGNTTHGASLPKKWREGKKKKGDAKVSTRKGERRIDLCPFLSHGGGGEKGKKHCSDRKRHLKEKTVICPSFVFSSLKACCKNGGGEEAEGFSAYGNSAPPKRRERRGEKQP